MDSKHFIWLGALQLRLVDLNFCAKNCSAVATAFEVTFRLIDCNLAFEAVAFEVTAVAFEVTAVAVAFEVTAVAFEFWRPPFVDRISSGIT